MYNIISVKNISENQWHDYFNMSQELNEKYYPDRFNKADTVEVFRSRIEESYKKTKGYENYLIKLDNLSIGWFYTTTWGEVFYIGPYINYDVIGNDIFNSVLKFAYDLMKKSGFQEMFTSSYRKANIDFFIEINAEITEEFVSSQIKREEINISLFNSIVNNFNLNDHKTIFCNRIEEEYADSYLVCFNIAFRDLMNLNKAKLKYEPFTKEQLIYNQNGDNCKRIILLLNKMNIVIGFSELFYDKEQRIYSCDSGFTAVHPEYRGRGAAKFLKAKLYLDLVNEDTIFNSIRTNTLDCNKYINNINYELGFKEYRRGYSFRLKRDFIENYLNNIE